MAAVDAGTDQCGARAGPRLDGRGGVRSVEPENVSDTADTVLIGQSAQLSGQVVVVGAVQVGHQNGDGVFT